MMVGSNMVSAGRSYRPRAWASGIVVVALIALMVAVAGAPPAGALEPSLCVRNPNPGNPNLHRLIAHDDGGTTIDGTMILWKHSTTWNVPLAVDDPSVLDNDGYAGAPDIPLAGRLRAILWSQTTHGTVQLHDDGTWVYTPGAEHPPEAVVESFQYVAFDTANGMCSDPATVTFEVDGYTEVLGRAPTAFADRFPADGSALAANDVLQVPAPGVLVNDFNNDEFPYEANRNLVAGLVSQPVWEGTLEPAGTVTDWGKRIDQGVTVYDNSGGFTYTAPAKGFGTATFSYVACYRVRSTTATACSEPSIVRIEVARTAIAQPFNVVLQSGSNGTNSAELTSSILDSNVTFNSPARTLFPRFGAPTKGTLEVDYWPIDIAEHKAGDFLQASYQPGPDFTGTDQFTYRMCDTKEDTPTTVCTNESTITVQATAAPPKVTSVTLPTADDPLILHLDQDVRGITTTNITLAEYRADGLRPVEVELTCTSGRLPGTTRYACEGNFGDTVYVRPVAGWRLGADYHLRVNRDDATGIVAAGDMQALPLEAYTRTFRYLPPDFDLTPPAAAPTSTLNADGSITVAWNWSDAGVGIDPTRCPETSTSTGSEPQTLREFCFDRNGNLGYAAIDVEPQMTPTDTTPPFASPSVDPIPTGTWSGTAVTVSWNWSDGDGSGIDPTRCTTSSTSSGEGLILLEATCTDLAGNKGVGQQSVRVDTTAPTLKPKITPRRVLLGGVATAVPNAADPVSGVAAASCGTVDTRTLGARSLTCSATDHAGHTSVATVPYTVGVNVEWIARPSPIWYRSPSVLAIVRLTDARGTPISDKVARSLPACSVTFSLGNERPICAVYLAAGMFGANIVSKQRLTAGPSVALKSKVTIDGIEVGATSTNVVVK